MLPFNPPVSYHSLCPTPFPLCPNPYFRVHLCPTSLSVVFCDLLPPCVPLCPTPYLCVPRRRDILRRSTLLYGEIPYSTERLLFYRETTVQSVLQRNYTLCTDGPNGLPYQGILPRGLYPLASN